MGRPFLVFLELDVIPLHSCFSAAVLNIPERKFQLHVAAAGVDLEPLQLQDEPEVAIIDDISVGKQRHSLLDDTWKEGVVDSVGCYDGPQFGRNRHNNDRVPEIIFVGQ